MDSEPGSSFLPRAFSSRKPLAIPNQIQDRLSFENPINEKGARRGAFFDYA
jgi:hypothetical protein